MKNYNMSNVNIFLITAGLVVSGFVHSSSDITHELNTRYANAVDVCDNNRPAYYCSGVLIRGTASTASDKYKPWEPSEHAITLGSTSFSFLRKDINIKKLYRTNGFLFNEQSESEEQGTDIAYHCSFPYEADTLSRPGHGCSTPAPETAASCASLGINNVTQWLEYMVSINSKIESMCSFSTDSPTAFLTSILAHDSGQTNLVPAPDIPEDGDYNEILLQTWALHQTLPVQAFWFIEGDETAKAEALNDRESYYVERGIYVPVVIINLKKHDAPFTGAL